MPLSNRQLSFLRGLGQQLKPALHLGREGLTDGTQGALEELFAHRELVKVRILTNAAASARQVAASMAGTSGAEVVGVIGHTFVLYRPNPELKERIRLPEAAERPGAADTSHDLR